MERSRDSSTSPRTRSPRDTSPKASTAGPSEDARLGNGYVSSPLRTEQRLNSIQNKSLPDLSASESPRPSTAPHPRFPSSSKLGNSFPFNAQPGTYGQLPTTGDLIEAEARDTGSSELGPPRLGQRRTNASGTETPPERRSVQFARTPTEGEASAPGPLSKSLTWETDEENERDAAPGRGERQGSFFTRLKALASPASSNHVRTASNTTGFGTPTGPLSPQSERSEPTYPGTPREASEVGGDADVEETSDEDQAPDTIRPKRKRKSRRPPIEGSSSNPNTPRTSRFASFIREHQLGSSSGLKPPPEQARRGTMDEIPENERAGVSEDEGRDRIRNAWRRGIEGARGLSYSARKNTEGDTPDGRRPHGFRRALTGFGGTDGTADSLFALRTHRHNSSSVQKWRQVKNGLRMLGQRKKDERIRVDHQKSAQLMAELLAGAPAALFFASMYQRDEHGHKRIPVLLEQLKISIPSSHMREVKGGDRHMNFRIDLEYGNGPARMKWTIHRLLRDFINLHVKYKVSRQTDMVKQLKGEDKNRAKIPRFPKSAFPYLRSVRGLASTLQQLDDEDDEEEGPDASGLDGEASGTERPGHRRQLSSMARLPRRKSSTADVNGDPDEPGGTALSARQRELYAERQRKKLEIYLQQMIRWLIFRPDSTRLCKFLEVSALSIRLSAEGGYQGKQGLLTIASRRNRELRRKLLGPSKLYERHHPRWFLVRHSYIVCVDGPESLEPYDVFLVDSAFSTEKHQKRIRDQTAQEMAKTAAENSSARKHLLLRMYNSERKLKLIARNERQLAQFKESVEHMALNTLWSKKQRFDSFAPVRSNVWARWLVDARDHMWQVSRAIDNAKDFVFIHDWWLSPELYMRRPAAISQKWRLDRLLQRKAQEGVKIFVIVYRNVESAIPIDSEYTKWSLLDLHENICIQRSPNQFRQNQFFWAHHEKLVIVDNMMAFVGGVDLCFGRWDEPCHTLTDDKLTGFELDQDVPRDSEHCQNWPGKDYSNPRVQDFYALDRPYEEMYDRTKVPRMPWHDISMQIVGQPARDVGRHFVQRWNYILRQRVPSRPTPVLMPPPEFEDDELDRLGMTGSCQIQILRSCSPWSIGTPNKVEHSIMNAYVALIENSEHFIYIENQFFVSSCTVEGTVIHNKIGDALVERICRAYENDEAWQATLVIPLMPGFQNSVDSQDGTSVRLIMQCQYRSICRGDKSIFARCKARGIDPEKYIRFYSLRQWGKIGPRKCLTTEQLYIHAKCMIVDDRSVIIGSANINERSMLGSRDSEVASVVVDTRMIPSFMGGEPYDVGEFPHTLRKRLMREHLGVDVDAIYRREQLAAEAERAFQDAEMDRIYRPDYAESRDFAETPMDFETPPQSPPATGVLTQQNLERNTSRLDVRKGEPRRWVEDTTDQSPQELEPRVNSNANRKGSTDFQRDLDVEGLGPDNMRALGEAGNHGMNDTSVDVNGRETLQRKDAPGVRRIKHQEHQVEKEASSRRDSREQARADKDSLPRQPPWPTERTETSVLGLTPRYQLPELPTLDDTDIGGPALQRNMSKSSTTRIPLHLQNMHRPQVTEDCMTDPIHDEFYYKIWHQVAENNTKIYRQVFRCMPDSEVRDWKQYEMANDYNERFMQSQGLGNSKPKPSADKPPKSGPPGSGGTGAESVVSAAAGDKLSHTQAKSKGVLGGMIGKFRPGSKTSNSETTHTEEAHEKEFIEKEAGEKETGEKDASSNGSPETGVPSSEDPNTAVPSPNPQPLDEKEGQRLEDERNNGPEAFPNLPSNTASDPPQQQQQQKDTECKETHSNSLTNAAATLNPVSKIRTIQYSSDVNAAPETTATQSTNIQQDPSQKQQQRRRRATTKSSGKPPTEEVLTYEEAEKLLKMVQGHLVLWPYDWLEKEEKGGNWLYNIDQLAPLEIYD
ncbi:hypothetical protein MBLNU230_g4023t2 [Neophaeotheca triangularis]